MSTRLLVIAATAVTLLAGCRGGSHSSASLPTGGAESTAVVETIIPADGERDVPVDQLIAVVFSEEMDARSIDRDSFLVRRDGEPITGVVAALGERATFRPEPGLEKGGDYEIVLTRDVRDLEGRPLPGELRFGFSTEPLGPFEIVRIVPGANARGVALGAPVTVTLSRPVDPDSVGPDTIRLTRGTTPVLGRLSIDGDELTLQPDRSFDYETVYEATVADSIRAIDGASLDEGRRWRFTTTERFLPAPLLDPEEGSQDLPVDLVVTATFDRALDPSTVNEDTFHLLNAAGDRIEATVSYADRVATLEPAPGALFFDATYTAVLTRGIRGAVYGETFVEDVVWKFATGGLGPHRAIFVGRNTPENGVTVFLELPGGQIREHPDSPFATAGASGGDILDGIALSADGRSLLAVNAVSRDLASLRVGAAGGLTPASGSPFSLPGVPLAVEAHPSQPLAFVAVADEEGAHLEVLEIRGNGALTPRGSPLELGAGIPAQLTMQADGRRLFVSYRNLGRVDVYATSDDGSIVLLQQNAIPLPGTAGVVVTPEGRFLFLLDEDPANQELWAYFVAGDGGLTAIKGAPFDTAPGAGQRAGIVLRSGRKLYIGHVSSHITVYDLDPSGEVAPSSSSPFSVSDLRPRVLTGLDNGPHLYLVEEAPAQLRRLKIEGDGGLEPTGEPLPIDGASEASGIVVRDRIGLEQDLVLHLPFDGDFEDVSGREHHAQPFGDPTFDSGRIGQSVIFDGSPQFLFLGLHSDLQFGALTDFTVSLWYRTQATIRDAPIIANKDWSSGANLGWVIAAQDDDQHWQWSFKGDAGGRVDFDNGGFVTDDVWHHLVVTHDRDGAASFYQDGELLETQDIASSGSIDSGLPLVLGQDGTLEYEHQHVGRLDDVALWRRVLDAEEVADLWQRGQNGESF